MKAKRDIKPISYLRSHTAELISQVNETKEPLYVTQNGEAKAVILDTDSFEKLKEVSNLLKMVSFGERDIQTGDFLEQTNFYKEFEKRLAK